MPELPEVEGFARYFAQHALRQPITRVRVRDERILGVRKETLSRALRGHAFERVQRHGKHLFAEAGDAWLHLHFGMTGDLEYYSDDEPRFARVIFDFPEGHLAFVDMRLFGVVDLTPSPDAYIEEHDLGPDPLLMSLPQFRALIAKRRGAVKALLLSQDFIAGIGNLYADETLFQTSIHPRRPVHRLSDAEVRDVYNGMRRILREVIRVREKEGDWPARYLSMHREEGERCPKCGGTIQRTVVMSRTTYFCARHQK
ncbi:MAG TPA: DNA-formamidopyrimidine glycosylase family protein [Thermoanaerobaculia bacterium]|jgi:formamidopyrimidine-DNA glycosylase